MQHLTHVDLNWQDPGLLTAALWECASCRSLTLLHTHPRAHIYRSYTHAHTLRNFNLWWSEGSHGTTGKHSTLSRTFATDDLRKSRGLHSVNAYRHGLYIYQSLPADVAQSRRAFAGGTVSTWARWRIPANKRQKRHQKCRSNTQCAWGTCRSDSRFHQTAV